MSANYRRVLLRMFDAAVAAASPSLCLRRHLPEHPKGRTIVIGAGKAAAAMAAVVERDWQGPIEGVVVTRYGHGVPCGRIKVIEAGHPVPDEMSLEAAQEVLRAVSGLSADDLVIVLLSGGGSSLLTLPAGRIPLRDKQAVSRSLLRCGAPISEINVVRKHLSALKGGRLALAAAPARVVGLIISDAPGDDPAVVASGPTTPDATFQRDALAILARYGIEPSNAIRTHLAEPQFETPKPDDPRLADVSNIVIANGQMSLEAAAKVAREEGVSPLILGSAIEGEAREVGRVHAAIALQCAGYSQPLEIPCVLISGGETTVTVRGRGRGGRNGEFLLGAALALRGHAGIAAIAADTDGIDGTDGNAGAIIGPDTLRRAAQDGIDVAERLQANDAYSVFSKLNDLVVTGPTLTNVNDFRALLVFGRT